MGESGEAEKGSKSKCEVLLARLIASEDGSPPELLKLCGVGVPSDVDVYLCKQTFTTFQVRAKTVDQPEGLEHDYQLDPASIGGGRAGVYELQCSRSKHHVQVKVQPALGLADLLPTFEEIPSAAGLGQLLQKDIWTVLGIYHLLNAFGDDPARSSAPLVEGYDDCTKHIGWVLADGKALDKLIDKCNIFGRSYGSPPTLSLLDPKKPRTRGLLQKAFLEVKMLLIRAIWQIQTYGDLLLSAGQVEDFEAFMLHAFESCFKGGAEAQSLDPDQSAEVLRKLVCGGTASAKSPPGDAVAEPSTSSARSIAGGAVAGAGLGAKSAQLERALEGALQNLLAAQKSLVQAGLLGGHVDVERSSLAQLCAGVTAQLDHAKQKPSDDERKPGGDDAKRRKTS